MEIANYLNQLADKIVTGLQASQSALKNEIIRLEEQVLDKKSDLESSRMASQRRLKFSATLGGKYQCPECFIVNNVASELRLADASSGNDGILKCRVCQSEFPIPF